MAKQEYTVVWSGRDSLLPERDERMDDRYGGMPSYDLDDGEFEETGPRRKYNRTGKHVGKFSRTNPAAAQFVPKGTNNGS